MNAFDMAFPDREPRWWVNSTDPTAQGLYSLRNRTIVIVSQYSASRTQQKVLGVSPNTLRHYLDEEYYRVVETKVINAYETIRWEQPALVLIEGQTWRNSYTELIEKLQADILTNEVQVVFWSSKVHTPATIEALAGNNRLRERVLLENSLDGLRAVLENINITRPAPVQSDSRAGEMARFRKLLIDRELKDLVDVAIEDWDDLQFISLLSRCTDLIFNAESLWHLLGLEPGKCERLFARLEKAGLIEPLEYDGEDPLFSVVAYPEKMKMLKRFAAALETRGYRQVLATYILSREKTG